MSLQSLSGDYMSYPIQEKKGKRPPVKPGQYPK